jgi:hypothetical protein
LDLGSKPQNFRSVSMLMNHMYVALFCSSREGTEEEETAEEETPGEPGALRYARRLLQEHEMASCHQGGEETGPLRHSEFPGRGSAAL